MSKRAGSDGGGGGTEREREGRYSHLLEPIRDLASNWSIDLASELEEYLAELENITISFDGGATNLNFAEAALLIQGSACIYSKKVEYLYSLLYQTLDVLIEKRKQAKSSVNADGVDSDVVLFQEPEFLALDDALIEATNIDLDETVGSTLTGGPTTRSKSHLLTRTPLSLLSSGNQNSQSVRATHTGEKPEFKVSTSFVHRSGALLLESRDRQFVDASFHRAASMTADLPFGSPKGLRLDLSPIDPNLPQNESKYNEDGNPTQPDFNQSRDQNDDYGLDMAGGNDEDYEGDGRDGLVPDGSKHEAFKKSEDFSKDSKVQEMSQQSVSITGPDPWTMMDPHDNSTERPQPFRKGKTYRLPTSTDLIALRDPTITLNEMSNLLFNDTDQQPSMQAAVSRSIAAAMRASTSGSTELSHSSHRLKLPYFVEFAELFGAVLQKRRAARLQHNLERRKRRVADRQQAHDDNDDNGLDFGDFGDDDHDDQWDKEDEEQKEEADADPMALDEELTQLSKTYEELCREHIEAYVSSAEQYAQESNLSKRVADWQSRLAPILEEEDSHLPFDIHAYGLCLIDALTSLDKPEAIAYQDQRDAEVVVINGHCDNDDDKTTEELDHKVCNFGTAVGDRPKYEVCRMFLATLQLANSGNVHIIPTTDAAGMAVRLLSTRPPTETMDNYMAPSRLSQPAQQPLLPAQAHSQRPQKGRSKKSSSISTSASVSLSHSGDNVGQSQLSLLPPVPTAPSESVTSHLSSTKEEVLKEMNSRAKENMEEEDQGQASRRRGNRRRGDSAANKDVKGALRGSRTPATASALANLTNSREVAIM